MNFDNVASSLYNMEYDEYDFQDIHDMTSCDDSTVTNILNYVVNQIFTGPDRLWFVSLVMLSFGVLTSVLSFALVYHTFEVLEFKMRVFREKVDELNEKFHVLKHSTKQRFKSNKQNIARLSSMVYDIDDKVLNVLFVEQKKEQSSADKKVRFDNCDKVVNDNEGNVNDKEKDFDNEFNKQINTCGIRL